MVRLNYLIGSLRSKVLLGLLLLVSLVVYGANNIPTTNVNGDLTVNNLTADTVPYSDSNKKFTSSAVTPTELGYVGGVTSAIQTQLGLKLDDFTSSTDNQLMRSDGTGGTAVQESGITVDDNNNISGIGKHSSSVTATENDIDSMRLVVDAAGYADIEAIDVDYITGALAPTEEDAVLLINIDETAATGGTIVGLEVLATEGSADAAYGMKVGAGIGPFEQASGSFSDQDSSLNIAANALTEFTTSDPGGANNVQIFVNDNDTITLGDAAQYSEIEVILEVVASGSGIAPTFEYSTGVGTWATFSPIDGTSGFRNTGVIAWDVTDIPSWAVGTGTEYLIRITRTRNSLATVPTEDKILMAITTSYKWDKDGNANASTLQGGNLKFTGNILSSENNNGDINYTPNGTGEHNFTGDVNVLAQKEVRFQDASGGEYMGLKAPNPVTASTTLTLPDGDGTSGQVLSTNGSNTLQWTTVAGSTPTTTKGDLFTYSTADDRLAVGTDGYVLQADSAEATGLKWVDPADDYVTVTEYLTGTAQTYTTPAGVTRLEVYMVGGGGGGAGSGTATPGAAGAGGPSSFGNLTANGGGAGSWGSQNGAIGGTATVGSGWIGHGVQGGGGHGVPGSGSETYENGGGGGASGFAGGGGYPGAAGNSGEGGKGANNTSAGSPGAGGGAGGYVHATTSGAPAASYTYSVGTVGTAGTAGGGAGASDGVAGALGKIVIFEYYN